MLSEVLGLDGDDLVMRRGLSFCILLSISILLFDNFRMLSLGSILLLPVLLQSLPPSLSLGIPLSLGLSLGLGLAWA